MYTQCSKYSRILEPHSIVQLGVAHKILVLEQVYYSIHQCTRKSFLHCISITQKFIVDFQMKCASHHIVYRNGTFRSAALCSE